MMPCRIQHLALALEGLQKTGIPLVEFDGKQFLSAATADDTCGIYIIIPKIALLLQVPIEQAINIFLYGIILSSSLIAIAGFWHLFASSFSRCFALISVCIFAAISYTLHDIYIVPSMLALAIVPWTLYFFSKPEKSYSFYLFLLASGFGIATAHYIREHSGTAPLLFLGTYLLFKTSRPYSFRYWIMLVAGMASSVFLFEHSLQQHHNFMRKEFPDAKVMQTRPPFWHNTYIGLGFITNDLGLAYSDGVGFEKVASIDPTIAGPGAASSPQYETILRQETLKVITKHPFYFVRLLVAKISLTLFYLLLCGHIGLVALWLGLFDLTMIVAFVLALGWSSLPGVIAIPSFYYLSGFATFAGILGVIGFHKLTTSNYFSARWRWTVDSIRQI